MTHLVDPIKLLQERSALQDTGHVAIARTEEAAVDDGVPYEIPLVPKAGSRLERMTVASTYRTPIPVLYDPATRTTFPISNEG